MSLNQNLVKRKEKLLEKMKEVDDAWCDIGTLMPSHLEKLKFVITAMQDETDSITFFHTFPKLSSHLDKILNMLVVLQCEFDILSCDDVLKCGVRTVAKCDPPVIPSILPVIETTDSGHPPAAKTTVVTKINSEPPEVIYNLTDKYEATEEKLNLDIEEAAPPNSALKEGYACVSKITSGEENDKLLTIGHAEIQQTTTGIVNNEEDLDVSCLNESKVDTVLLATKTIVSCVIAPNEVLEMVYSHGDNPWNFWLCYYPRSDLEHIVKNIKLLFFDKKLESLTNLPAVRDNVVVADGKSFIRGKILSVKPSEALEKVSVMILDVDSGRMKSFKLSSLWKMPQDIISVPAQAVNCQLQGLLGDSSIWCKENLKKCGMLHKFETLVQQTTLSVKFIRTSSLCSISQYIIDADCVNLETDTIFNVTEVVNNILIPALMCDKVEDSFQMATSPVQEVQNDVKFGENLFVEDLLLQSNKALTACTNLPFEVPHKMQCEPCISSVDKEKSELDESFSKMRLNKEEGESDFHPNFDNSRTVDLINNQSNVSPQMTNDGLTYGSNGEPLSDTLCSSDVSCVGSGLEEKCTREEIFDSGDVKQQRNSIDREVLHFEEHLKEFYCDKAAVLQKRDYKFLSNQTIVGIATYVNSPTVFCMQFFLHQDNEFTDLHKRMCEFYSKNKIIFPSVSSAQSHIGSYCAAMCPEDRKWYRAEIIEWFSGNESSVSVRFVDIGDCTVLKLDLIQPLAKHFADSPIMAQKCHLYGLVPFECELYDHASCVWSPYTLSVFVNLLRANNFYNIQLLEFAEDNSVGVVVVDPQQPGASINQRLIAMGQAKYLPAEDKSSVWDPMKMEYERYLNMTYDDEDACVAVTGYSPNDEKHFCKFFARNGKCFKGANCRKEHVLSHPGGWTSDRNAVYQDAFSQIVLPEVGETVHLQVTYVNRVNLFYVILNLDSNADEETLLTLNKYINQKGNLKAMKKLEVTPAVGQLVVARYPDGIWYRARVVDTDNDNNIVQVFFVDYGNTEWVSETYVRDIEPQYLHLPFQAIESSLAFVEMNPSVDDDSLGTIISLFKSLTSSCQHLRAKIISKDNVLNKLEMQLYDDRGNDIALSLAETGYVKISRVLMTPASGFPLPG